MLGCSVAPLTKIRAYSHSEHYAWHLTASLPHAFRANLIIFTSSFLVDPNELCFDPFKLIFITNAPFYLLGARSLQNHENNHIKSRNELELDGAR